MHSRARLNVALLFLSQALARTSGSAMMTTSALVGYSLAEHKGLATLGLGFQFTALMAITMPASLFMKRFGRRAGFIAGASLGASAGVILAWSLFARDFGLFCVGSALMGAALGISNFYRFAAAEVADTAFRPKAIALVMAGGVIAAIAGPELVKWSKEWVEPVLFAGTYMGLAVLPLGTIALLAFLRLPREEGVGATDADPGEASRPLLVVLRQPVFLVAVSSAMAAYGAMNLIMTATALQMVEVSAFRINDAAWIIQSHAVAMYLPSFVTGHLIRRFRALNVMTVGAVLNLLCIATNVAGQTIVHYWAALVLLGVGWNFMFIGATTLVVHTYRPAEKAKAQGLNDFLVFGTVAVTAMFSGTIHFHLGWHAQNLLSAPALVLALGAITWLRLKRGALVA
jgi:predicted MFS family arabinose efflux permease